MSEVKKVDPFVYWADCEDPDQSSMCWHKEDALTQINDHGGTLHELSHTSELTAAQSELAALREELAEVSGTLEFNTACWGRERAVMIDKQQTLTADLIACGRHRKAAEQRNSDQLKLIAGLVEYADNLLTDVNNAWGYAGSTGNPETHKDAAYAVAVALIAKPTESGASE